MNDQSYPVLRRVLSEFPILLTGWAAEFGVWSGESMALIAEHMPVIGFDSFKGLPEDWRPEFPKGSFGPADTERTANTWAPYFNSMIVPGWFADTVPTFPFPHLSLVHIDCDLYSSTVTALEGITSAVGPGTILVFDEHHGYDGWQEHEAKAFNEWREKYGVLFDTLIYGDEEAAFVIEYM